jgi:photosystem II stability/assembly factor-like uncharacterized protein
MKRAFVLLSLVLPLAAEAQVDLRVQESLLTNLRARQLGPTTMGGRISDLAVYEKEPRIFFMATAAGGLWKTENGGITTEVIFDRESTSALGAVAVQQNDPNVIWVGTGEASSRNSVSWGDGVYKTTDGGKTWQNVGLRNTKHISKIIIHPTNPNVVYVAALGHLWGYNDERGLYRTSDGGKTWERILFVDDKSGIIDLQLDPKNPNTIYASSWERLRKPYNWMPIGMGSALWKSTDAGKTWRKLTKGLPITTMTGRIGFDIHRSNPRIMVATVEHYLMNDGKRTPDHGFYRSEDGGESWTKMSNTNPRPFYFSMPRIDPVNPQRVYVPAVQIHVSDDGGKTFRILRTTVHVDHHAMWINPTDSNHIIIGQDGGIGQTRDGGSKWESINNMPLGQYYAIGFDMRKPYWVYGGLQDNGSWATPTQTTRGGVAFWDSYNVGGGDGFFVQVDPNDWTTLYSESQGGAVSRRDQRTGEVRFIRPNPPRGEIYRWNWSTPIHISPHNSRTIYVGANKLFRSVDRGDNWQVISPDLTENNPQKWDTGIENTGAERHNTIITISESPRRAGVIWVGTDDGNVQVTQDGGVTWTNVTANVPGLPPFTWCSRVTASKYEEGRAYATFDGHRNNDYKPYVFVTEDFGATWRPLHAGIPENDSCYVIKEGERNPNLLYLGTERSLYISFDRGQNWARFRSGEFPTVPIHDLAVHPRELDLIIGTHGRSILILPVGALEEMTEDNLKKDVHLARPANIFLLGRVTGGSWDGDRVYASPNTQPGTQFSYYLKADAAEEATIVVADAAGETVHEVKGPAKAGLNVVSWNGRVKNRIVPAGDYRVTLKVGGREYVTSLRVEDVMGEFQPPRQ